MALKVLRVPMPKEKYAKKCPYKMKAKGVVVHNTANKASALSEVSYMIRNNNAVSFHAAVDDYQVVESISMDRNAFHAGDGRSGNGNRNYYSVEICYSTGDSEKFKRAEENAAYYIASILKQKGWGIDKVKKHQDFSGKYCPHKTLDLGWERFLNLIRKFLGEPTVTVPDKKPSVPSKPSKKIEEDGSFGKGTTKAAQFVYKTEQDGIVSKQPKSNKKYLANAWTGCWMFYVETSKCKGGSALIKAIQKDLKSLGYYKGEIDGWCGKQTIIALQKFLRDKGFYKGAIDGSMGKQTVIAFQKYLNTKL